MTNIKEPNIILSNKYYKSDQYSKQEYNDRVYKFDQFELAHSLFSDLEVVHSYECKLEKSQSNIFVSKSIKQHPNLQIEFTDSKWYHSSIFLFLIVRQNNVEVKIHSDYYKPNLWTIAQGLAVIDDPWATWNNVDKYLINSGYDSKFVRAIERHILSTFNGFKVERSFTTNGGSKLVRITNPEDLPCDVSKLMAFI